MGWLRDFLFGKNKSKSNSQKQAQKKNNSRKKQQGVVSVLKQSAGVAKDAVTISSNKSSKSQKQAASRRISSYKNGNTRVYNSYVKAEQKKQAVKKEKPKSAFEKFTEAAKENATRFKANQDSLQPTAVYKNAADVYREAAKKRAEKEKLEAQKKSTAADKKAALNTLDSLKTGPVSLAYKKAIDKEVENTKKNFEKKDKKERLKEAGKALDKGLTQVGAKGLVKQQKEVKKSTAKIKKEAAENKPKQLTTDEAMKSMAMARNRANNSKLDANKGYDKKYYSDELREKIRKNIQGELDRGSAGTGFMSGSMPVADLKKSVEKTYGVKLDDSKAKNHLGYNIGEMAGYLAKSATFGGAQEAQIAKPLTKVVAKKSGKKSLGKAGQFAVNRAAEAISSAPVNLEDAAKNSKDIKEFTKNVAINAGLDAGFGSVIDGVGAAAKASKGSQTKKILTKLATGEAMSETEKKALKNTVVKAMAKSRMGEELAVSEKAIMQNMDKVGAAMKKSDSNVGGVAPQKAIKTEVANTKPKTVSVTSGSKSPNTSLSAAKLPSVDSSLLEAAKKNKAATRKTTYLKEESVAPEYKKTFNEFVDNVDDELVEYASRTKAGNVGRKERHKFGGIKRNEASKIEALTGKDVDGYSHAIGVNDIEHIERRHGTNGEADKTMSDINDIGRIKYVIENYDDIKRTVDDNGKEQFTHAYLDKEGKPAPLITYEKRVNGHTFVVEAVTDTSKNEVRVMTAYMNPAHNKKAPHTVDAKSPTTTSETAYVDAFINPSIPEAAEKINTEALKAGDIADETLFRHAKDMRKNGFSDADIEVQLSKMGVDSQKAADIVRGKITPRTYDDIKSDPNTANVLIDTKQKKDTFAEKTKSFVDNASKVMVDDLHYIEKAAKDIGGENGERLYHMANVKRQVRGQIDNTMYNAQTDFNGHSVGKSVKDICGKYVKNDKQYQELNDYIFHRVNIERYPKGKYVFGKDVTDLDSINIVKELGSKNPEFSKTFDECVTFFKNERKSMEDAGIIAPGEYDIYDNFISVHRDVPKEAKNRKNIVSASKGIYKAKGSNLDILPIHEQMYEKVKSNRQAIANNEIVKTLAKSENIDMKDIPADMTPKEFIESGITTNTADGKFYGGYWENGKYHSAEVSKDIYDALNSVKSSDKMFMKNAWRGTDIYKKLITEYSGFFTFRNGSKDFGEALFQAESLPGFLAAYPKAAHSMFTNGDYYQLWKNAGGKYANITTLKDGLKVKGGLEKLASALNPFEWIRHLNYVVETIPRMAEFTAVLDKELAGKSVKEATRDMVAHASHAAADVTTNFSRGGTFGKELNRTFVPFLNPSIQGVNKLYRTLKGEKGIKGYASLATKLIAIGFAPGAIQDIMYRNDDDYNNLSERDKNNALMIKGEDGKFTKFWYMPRAVGTLTIPARQALRTFLGTGEMDFKEICDAFANNIAPVSPLDSNIVSPTANAFANKTWYNGEIDSYTDMKKPAAERTNKDTTVLAKFIGKHTGISPQRIDYVLDGYTGFAGDVIMPMATADNWRRILRDGKAGINATLKYGVKNIYDQNMKLDPVYKNKSAVDYYEAQEKAEQKGNGKNATIEEKAEAKYFKENSYRIYDINDTLADIEENKNLTFEQRTEKRKVLKIELNRLYRTGMESKEIFTNYVKKHEKDFDTKKSLYAAAWRQVEKSNSSVKQLDVISKTMGIKYALKQESGYYTDDGDKKEFKDKRGNTVYDYAKKYVKNGGGWSGFFREYKVLRKYTKETGGSLDLAYSSAVPILIRSGKISKVSSDKMYAAYGVTDKDKEKAKLYFQRGGSVKEFEKASEYMTNACNSGDTSNYFAPFKAIGLAKMKAPDRVYDAVDSEHVSVKTSYKMNTGRGLVEHKISAKRLMELNEKCKKDLDGYNIKESVEKVVDKTNYSKEEKALLWDALYGLSYRETNPYGAIGDYSLKDDIGIESGGYGGYSRGYGHGSYGRSYGHGGYGRRGGGSGGSSSEEKSEFEKYTEALLKKQQGGNIDAAKMNYGSRKLKKYNTDAYVKAVAKIMARKLMEK